MRRPSSTYRLQLNGDFGFAAARALVSYLRRLGVGDLYLSPILAARPGSAHGYDVVDPTRVNPELGGREGLDALAERLHDADMGLLLDIVPNHMAAHHANPWWWDVLRRGRASEYADHFDIDWTGDERVLLPVLGKPLEQVLEAGEIEFERANGERALRYYEHRFPLRDDGAAEAVTADLLDAQHYRLAHWRRAASEINYRRFFDISDLIAVRVEDAAVFDAVHVLVRELVADDVVTGLRVDHVDGLRDPHTYLRRLQERVFGGRHGYVLVEKILEADEDMPGDWPADGTTGYDFLNAVNGLFVDAGALERLSRIYSEFTGSDRSFEDVVFRRKLQVQAELFPAELGRIAAAAAALYGDVAADRLRAALAATTAAFARYRTYFSRDRLRDEDRRLVRDAVSEARRRDPRPGGDAYAAVEDLLTLHGHSPPDVSADKLDVVMRWQQYSGPVMAKGHEDTALYVYNRLVSANAVGGDPSQPATQLEEFHRLCRRRMERPGALNATSTHDSKRSEDVRARIDVLSEAPDAWQEALQRWRALNEPLVREVEGATVPGANIEMLAYQTLVGALPLERDAAPEFAERFGEYLLKAAREAKTHTSWLEPNQAYERTLRQWSDALLSPEHGFLEDLRAFAAPVAFHGAITSLAQTTLKLTTPGVPDVYQGTELWDYSLVDPDNRRPVDYVHRGALLDAIEPLLGRPNAAAARELWRDWRTGAVKLYVTASLLRDRRAQPDLYREGDHLPIAAEGGAARHVCAFLRRKGGEWRLIAVPLRLWQGGRAEPGASGWPAAHDRWADVRLPLPQAAPDGWRDRLTGEHHTADGAGALSAAALFADLPIAVLEPSRG